jgi:hypothetical protein
MREGKLAWMLAAALAGGAALQAQAQAGAAGKPAGHEMSMMDANHDGKLSPEEHAEGARHMFEQMDADKDGKVTAAEMTSAHDRVTGKKPAKGEMSAAEKIKTIDRDGDGVLTAEEHREGARAMFEQMDADKDGVLTSQELAAGHAKKMRKPS